MKKYLSILSGVLMLAGCSSMNPWYRCEERLESGQNPVYFAYDSAQLSAESMETINDAAIFLAGHRFRKVQLDAYTDERGDAEYNLKLAQKRAESIKQFWVDNGVCEKNITIVVHGEVAGQNYRNNRRVDINIK